MKKIKLFCFVATVCLLALSLSAYGQTRVTVGTMKNSAIFGNGENLTISMSEGNVNVSGKNVSGSSNLYASMPMTDKAVMRLDFTRKHDNSNVDNKVQVKPSISYNDKYYTTLYAPYNLIVPESNVCAVYMPELSGDIIKVGSAQLLEPESILPIGTGVIVVSENNDEISFPVTTDNAASQFNSALSGTSVSTPVYRFAPKAIYALSKVGEKVGFYHYVSTHTGVCKAFLTQGYLEVTNNAKFISLVFDDDNTTNITSVENRGDGQTYNTLGQKVSRNAPGIVIRNGKKYINK